jgi:hypothetical protein
MSEAIFKKEHLRNYKVIPGPGTFMIKVSNTVKPEYLYEDGAKSRFIVNLRCATVEGFEDCLSLMKTNEVAPFDLVRDCFMSGAIWENDLDDLTKLPIKAEEVIATFDYVDDILRCVALTLIPRKELNNFDLDAHCRSRKLFLNLIR